MRGLGFGFGWVRGLGFGCVWVRVCLGVLGSGCERVMRVMV